MKTDSPILAFPDVQMIMNEYYYSMEGGTVRPLTKFDYLVVFNQKELILGAQDNKTYSCKLNGITYTFNKKFDNYIEQQFPYNKLDDLIKSEKMTSELLNGMVNKLSEKESNNLPSVFDIKSYIPVFYSSGFVDKLISAKNYDILQLIDPVAGFPVELRVVQDEIGITLIMLLNVDYIKPY